MDIIQVIIFIIIIVAAIVQQISKTGKEKKTPSPKKVLADIFPEIEQENIEEDLPVSSVQTVRTPQTPRMQHQPMVKKPTDSPRKENKREDRTPIRLSTKEEARRAFIYSVHYFGYHSGSHIYSNHCCGYRTTNLKSRQREENTFPQGSACRYVS